MHGHTHAPTTNKWGICADNCPIEDCPTCENRFSYKGKNYTGCTNEGWLVGAANHFGNSDWCYFDKHRYIWKFCSDRCTPTNNPTNVSCITENHKKYHENRKKEHFTIYRQYQNLFSNCTTKQSVENNQWCPIQLDDAEKAICINECA